MKLLILGGTGFLGPHIVEDAIEHGHTMTLFNRGRTNPQLFPDLEKLEGDRDGDLKALEGREWDAVIDTSGYVPRIVKDSATLLASAVKQYVFISSISVYPDLTGAIDESTPVGRLDDPTVEEITGATYGPLKALCEEAAEAALPGRVTNIRPGLIVGPRDRSDRFTYWPVRVARGGEVLAPDRPDKGVQFIDVRDLARFVIQSIEQGHAGVYNAVGPYGPTGKLSMEELLHGCKVVSGAAASFTWVEGQFLIEKGVQPWMGLPLWIPGAGEEAVNCARGIAVGLGFRPVALTIRATLDWHATLPEDRRWRAGITADKEAEVLKAWHSRDR